MVWLPHFAGGQNFNALAPGRRRSLQLGQELPELPEEISHWGEELSREAGGIPQLLEKVSVEAGGILLSLDTLLQRLVVLNKSIMFQIQNRK